MVHWPKPQLCPCAPRHVRSLCFESLCHPACHPGQESPLTRAKGHPHFAQNGNSHSSELCGKTTPECQQQGWGGGAQKDSLRWAQGLGSAAAGWNRTGQSGSPGQLPRLRGWCLRPSNAALFPAQDPAGRVGALGPRLASPNLPGWSPAESHWVRPTQGSRPQFPASSPTPPSPGPFFHPGRFRGGRGRQSRLKRKRQRRPRGSLADTGVPACPGPPSP